MDLRQDTAAEAQARPDGGISSNNVRSLIQQKYFAALPGDMVCDALMERVADWVNYTDGTAHFRRIEKSLNMYYGFTQYGAANSSQIIQAGPQGQYSLAFVNEFRNYIQHVLNMILGERLAFDCHGTNTDTSTTEACEIGNRVLEDTIRRLNVDKTMRKAVEYACFLSEGFIVPEWDSSLGKPYIYDSNGMPKFHGDISLDYFAPWDVIRDHWGRADKLNWGMVIRWKNKYDLAAKYPEKAEQIVSTAPELLWQYRQKFFNTYLLGDFCDLVPEISFYHSKTPAVPQGRLVRFIDQTTKLIDVPLPYDENPIIRIAPDDMAETIHGYSFAFDLLGVQDLSNLVDSIMATTFKTFGVGVVKLPIGHNAQYQQIAEGLAALVVNENNGKAEPMNFARLPEGVMDFRQWLSSRGDVLAGINSVIKGQPDSNIKAGNFAALIAAQAYQFMNQLQESYFNAARSLGQKIIEYYQNFPTTERIVETVGKNKEYAVSGFTKEKLKPVKSVTVDMGSASTKNPAARMNMADVLTAKGAINSVDQYVEVMETGNLDHATDRVETQQDGINRENEELRRGNKPVALVTDDPFKHVNAHLMILDDPNVRNSQPNVVNAALDHIIEHVNLWNQVSGKNLSLLQLMNVAPSQMGQMMGGVPNIGTSLPTQPQGQPPSPIPGVEAGAQTSLPSLPKNPLTDQPPPVNAGPIG